MILAFLVSAGDGLAQEIAPLVATSQARIEARQGQRLDVRFPPAVEPSLSFKPKRGVWDWSRTSRLVVPVANPGGEPLTLHLFIESAEPGSATRRSLSGAVAIAPRGKDDLTIRLDAPSPRAMGMTAGPSLAAAGLEPGTLPVTATRGAIDVSRVSAVRLALSHPPAPRRLIVGPPRVAPPSAAEQNPYAGIVDAFGQFRPGTWPEKVGSVAVLRARNAREARRRKEWLARSPRRDRFGGLFGAAAFRATGFFRTARRRGRWWLVTPDGNAFFSIGIDAVEPSGATYVEGREFMFSNLPARTGPLGGHWSRRDDRRGLGAQRGRGFDHGGTFDFYTANLERLFGVGWRARWRGEAAERLRSWGFNTIGNWSDPHLWALHRLPYTVPLSPEGRYATVSSGEDWWGPMPDPFDPGFAAAVERMAAGAAARFAGDPCLVGYFVDNELPWGRGWSEDPRERYSLALGALAAGPHSPAKSAFLADLIRTYREPERLGQAWGLALASWTDLERAGFAPPRPSLDRPATRHDLAAFSGRFADAYFRIVAEALHRHDPHHLYLGSRFAWQTPEAVAACARWCDVVSFNIYQRSIADDRLGWARFHALGKPALVGEFQFGSTDRGLFWEGLVGAGSESGRGPAYARYLEAVAANPDFVGAHWFAYLDEPLTGRTLDGENGHIGFVSVADVPYRGLVAAAREANAATLRRLQRDAAKTADVRGAPPTGSGHGLRP
jgi:hypothetical protein